MRYFYVASGNQAVGPLDSASLEALRRQGVITDATPVSREGDVVWRTYADFFTKPPPLPGGQTAPSAAASARPLAVTVFGIANIVFGGSGLLCKPISLIGVFMGAAFNTGGSAQASGWLIFLGVFGIFLSAALLISGIGMVRFRPWALPLALTYCLGKVVQEVATVVVSARHPAILGEMGGMEGALVPVILGVTLMTGLIYPVAMFVVLRLPAIRDAFQARE